MSKRNQDIQQEKNSKKKKSILDMPSLPEEEETGKGKWQKGDLKRLYSYAIPHWLMFVIIIVLMIVATTADLWQPRLFQILFDDYMPQLTNTELSTSEMQTVVSGAQNVALYFLGTVIISFTALYAQAILLQHTGQKILLKIRQELYEHILRLPTSFFDKTPLGSLVTRVTNDTETLNEMFTSVLIGILRNVFQLAGIVIVMFSLDARLAGYVMILLPFIVVFTFIFRNVIRKVYRAQRRMLSIINSKLAENISGMRTISVFHRQDQIKGEFDEINQEYLNLSRKEVFYYAVYRPGIEIVQSAGIGALLWFGGRGQLEGVISFGVLYAFINYIQRFFRPILELAETYNLVQAAMTSTGRIFRLMDEEEEPLGGSVKVPEGGLRGEIEFRNVYFAYEDENWILKDVSFKVEAGQFVAFVGATGAGKSTIMHLLCRFYDIQKGEILIDGVPIKEYDLRSLRKSIGVVQQNVFLYSGTIMQNITLDREEISEEAARKAAEIVNVDQFINTLPEHYDEPVTERGSTLSAGQRQLLSFARTIASEPSLLILDEATANIDTETEILIQDAIRKMSQNRSMIAVAHRISTIADADKIIVMHHGEVAEEGSKDELLAHDGLFRILYELQYQEN